MLRNIAEKREGIVLINDQATWIDNWLWKSNPAFDGEYPATLIEREREKSVYNHLKEMYP